MASSRSKECEKRGLITVRLKNGKIYCRSPPKKKTKKVDNNNTDREFMMQQTIVGLKAYIVSRDKNKKLKGYSKLKKADLVDYIIKHIDIETGKIFD